jgi:Helicase associated domain
MDILRVSKTSHESNNGLAWWLQSQRQRGRHCLPRERVAQLEEAGMEWDTTMMVQHQQDRDSNSNKNNSTALTTNENTPRNTTTTVRQDVAMRAVPRSDRWQVRFDKLVEYKRVHGTTLVPVNKSALGKWVANMLQARRDVSSGKRASGPTLTVARIQALNDIGFVWSIDRWHVRFG